MKKVEAWKCDYCGRLLKTQYAARTHESRCNYGPDKKHCRTCIHGGKIELWQDTDDGAYVCGYEPYCDKFDVPLSANPFFMECDDEIDHGQIIVIPWTCHHYEYKGNSEWHLLEES